MGRENTGLRGKAGRVESRGDRMLALHWRLMLHGSRAYNSEMLCCACNSEMLCCAYNSDMLCCACVHVKPMCNEVPQVLHSIVGSLVCSFPHSFVRRHFIRHFPWHLLDLVQLRTELAPLVALWQVCISRRTPPCAVLRRFVAPPGTKTRGIFSMG